MMRKCYIQTASLKDNIYCHVLLLLISKCVAVQITFCKIIFLIRKLFLTRNSKAFLKIKESSEIHFKFSSNPPCGDSRRIYKTPWSKEMLKNNKTITCPKHMELHRINVSRISQIYCDPSKGKRCKHTCCCIYNFLWFLVCLIFLYPCVTHIFDERKLNDW